MHVLTMEGLLGAGMNAKLVNTPMRAAGAAERRGDTGAMERALGYAGELTETAEAYQKKAETGMKKEAEEREEDVKKLQEKLAGQRAEEKEKQSEEVEAGELRKDQGGEAAPEEAAAASSARTEDVVYTETGELLLAEQAETGFSVSV